MSSVKDRNVLWKEGALYPERELPQNLDNLADRIDFLVRLCSAWDFGQLPYPETIDQILNKDWKMAVEETQLLTSCAYHLLRELHNLKPLPYIGPKFPKILNDPFLECV